VGAHERNLVLTIKGKPHHKKKTLGVGRVTHLKKTWKKRNREKKGLRNWWGEEVILSTPT